MAVDPAGYAWLSKSGLSEAGCVTVIADPDLAKLEKAFGFEPQDAAAVDEPVWLTTLDTAAVVAEDNGFQGTRAEVLGPTSRASRAGKAASVFWNVNGVIHFTCARRGRVLCAFELLDPDTDELEGLPRVLRPLVAQLAGSDADPIAIGAAMVETFTGTGFGPDEITAGRRRSLLPRADDLQDFDATDSGMLELFDPNFAGQIVALPSEAQRRLAHWAAGACVREAGLDTNPVLSAAIDRLDQGPGPRTATALALLERRVDQESSRRENELMSVFRDHGLAEDYSKQRGWAVRAARYAFHTDPLSAAIACVGAALVVASLSRTDRGTLFLDTKRGRWTNGRTPNPRTVQWVAVVRHALTCEPDDWPEILATLPRPLTPEERTQALQRDEDREAAHEFRTWQYEEPLDEEPPQPTGRQLLLVPSTADAVSASVACAGLLRLPADDPEVIAEGYSVRVRLRPAAVVTRVVTVGRALRPDPLPWLEREVSVARFLATTGVPIVAPWADPGPYDAEGLEVSLWHWVDHNPSEVSPKLFGSMLGQLHEALATYPGDLPTLIGPLTDISTAMAVSTDPTLHSAAAELVPLALSWPRRPLHGDAHTGNILMTPKGPVWTDFEDVCAGPVEWDLASKTVTEAALTAYPGAIDRTRLADCRDLRRLQVLSSLLVGESDDAALYNTLVADLEHRVSARS